MEGKLTRIGPVSYGKIMGVGMALFGLVFGLIMAIAISIGGAMVGKAAGLGSLAGIGWALVIVLPITYGIMGFLIGLISAALYNLFAKIVGGIEVKIE